MRGNKLASLDSYLQPPEPDDVPTYECDFCAGTGKDMSTGVELVCDACGGTGQIEVEECSFCDSYYCHCDEDYESWRDERD